MCSCASQAAPRCCDDQSRRRAPRPQCCAPSWGCKLMCCRWTRFHARVTVLHAVYDPGDGGAMLSRGHRCSPCINLEKITPLTLLNDQGWSIINHFSRLQLHRVPCTAAWVAFHWAPHAPTTLCFQQKEIASPYLLSYVHRQTYVWVTRARFQRASCLPRCKRTMQRMMQAGPACICVWRDMHVNNGAANLKQPRSPSAMFETSFIDTPHSSRQKKHCNYTLLAQPSLIQYQAHLAHHDNHAACRSAAAFCHRRIHCINGYG